MKAVMLRCKCGHPVRVYAEKGQHTPPSACQRCDPIAPDKTRSDA